MESKKPYLSKTLWTNALIAIFAIVWPGASEWVQENPSMVISGFAVINMILRLVTKDKLELWVMLIAMHSTMALQWAG